ncbi:MAG TPA: aldolase/citrate lyase family protein [Solirubrobacteraceae bacterium]|jgi:2-dehydro-3-deoxyglucarate aldolase/4-hydroxy-2-oxoheptanedioate aldolase|nr:aldolase/citrate lyase family protein [Solirubrobacteraceae bacterium]
MRGNPVKQALAAGERAVGAFLVEFNSLGIPRMLAAAGAEFVMWDQEHSGWSVETLRPLILAAHAAEIVPMVRVPALQQPMISAVLDAGAMGVMAPMIESAEHARQLVEAARYPPQGRRGVGPHYADEMDADLPSTLERMNRELLVLAMVETTAGVENVAEIAAVDGLDVLWIGHGDLTTSLGIPGQFGDRRFLDALDTIFAAARAHDKAVGFLCISPDDARLAVSRGVRCIGLGDRPLYDAALRAAQAAARES